MSEGHDLKNVRTRSYRFSGYKLPRDSNNNIIIPSDKLYSPQPEYWRTRAITLPQGSQPYDSLRRNP